MISSRNSWRIYTTYNQIHPYGLYLNDCSGYHVEGNEFYTDAPEPISIGFVIHNSGIEDNMIYNNSFSNLEFATLLENQNRSQDGRTGLCIKCNDFENNINDICVTSDYPGLPGQGIATNQGSMYNSPSAPAGNTFTVSSPDHYDIYNETNGITYIYHGINPTWEKIIPDQDCIFGNVSVVPNPGSNARYFKANSCPLSGGTRDNIEDLQEDMVNAEQKRDSIDNLLSMMIDGGSTENLAGEVNQSTPPEALETRDELLNESPYLSDSVMKAAIFKEEVLPNVMIRDILVANPQAAKSDEVLEALDAKANPMEEYLMEDIMQGLFDQGEKEEKETQLSHWSAEYALNFNQLVRMYLTDTIHSWAKDSLIYLLDHARYLPAKYGLANLYLEDGEYEQAFEVINSIPSIFTLNGSELADVDLFYNFH